MTTRETNVATDAVNIIHLVSLLGAVSVQDNTITGFILTLPYAESTTRAATQRAISLGLVERFVTGTLALSLQGKHLLRTGDVGFLSGLKPPKSTKPTIAHNSLRQRAWSAMRLSGRFTVGCVVTLAAQSETNAASNIKTYITQLTLAGYLVELPQRLRNSSGNAVLRQWRLVRDTGPHAPVYRPRIKSFFDPNLDDHIDCASANLGDRHVA